MAKIYTTDGKLLTEVPQIQIGDKLYAVDNRKSNYDAMQKAIAENDGKEYSDEDLIVKFALGEKQFKEIKAMDLSVAGYMNLILYIHAAILDISFEEAQKQFQRHL
jgi:hypothetical protein